MHALFAIIRNDFDYLHAFPIWPYFMCMDRIYKCYRYAASRMDPCEEYRSSSRTYTSGSRQSKRYITTKIAKAGPQKWLKRQKMSWRHAWAQAAIAIGINLGRLKSWACQFSISIPRFSVTLFPYQFVGQPRFLLPVPCLPGSQRNWRFLRNNLKKQSIPLIFAETTVKLHRDLRCIGPFSFAISWIFERTQTIVRLQDFCR